MFTFAMLMATILESKSQRHAYESEMNTLSLCMAEPGAGKSQDVRNTVALEEENGRPDNAPGRNERLQVEKVR